MFTLGIETNHSLPNSNANPNDPLVWIVALHVVCLYCTCIWVVTLKLCLFLASPTCSFCTVLSFILILYCADTLFFHQHHSYRSFLGFCCLMQISTRDHDYLIDTLELRHELYILNDSFTNPNVLKVHVQQLYSVQKYNQLTIFNIFLLCVEASY